MGDESQLPDEAATLRLLDRVHLGTVRGPRQIWHDDAVTVNTLHENEFKTLLRQVQWVAEHAAEVRGQRRSGPPRAHPGGVVIEGRPGAGKSHLLNRLRRAVQANGHLFVAAHLSNPDTIYQSLASETLSGLLQPVDDGVQLDRILRPLLKEISTLTWNPEKLLRTNAGSPSDTVLRRLAIGWAKRFGQSDQPAMEATVAQALVLKRCGNWEQQDYADLLLQGESLDGIEFRRLGLRVPRIPIEALLPTLERVIVASGRLLVLAIDQLDGLIADARTRADGQLGSDLTRIANVLMDLANRAEQSLLVLSCLPTSWGQLCEHGTSTMPDRFPTICRLRDLPSAPVAQELIGRLLKSQFESLGLHTPYPTWPIRQEAFKDATEYTPRALIQRVNLHIRACVEAGHVRELAALDERANAAPAAVPAIELLEPGTIQRDPHPSPEPDNPAEIESIERRFRELVRSCTWALDADLQDVDFSDALSDTLRAWVISLGPEKSSDLQVDALRGPRRTIDARLRRILNAEQGDELHCCIKLVHQEHHSAQFARVKAAITASGVHLQHSQRRGLILIRNTPWNQGPRLQELMRTLERRGGRVVGLTPEELGVIAALHELTLRQPAHFAEWLQRRQPVHSLPLLQSIEAAVVRT